VQWVFGVEYIFYQPEEYTADFRLYITAIRWVVPDDPSLSYGFDACIGVVRVVSVYELVIISTFSQRILILWDGIVENSFVSRYIT